MFDLLKKLCMASAPSGCEKTIAKLIEEEIAPYVDVVTTDALGNLIAHKKGKGKKLMFAAHMDEIGLVANCCGDKGQVYVSPLGGVNPYAALYQRVTFTGGAQGVVVPDGKLEDLSKGLTVRNLYVDIGAKSEEEALAMVGIGEAAVFEGAYMEQGDRIVSKALDNRVGCFILLEAVKQMKAQENDLYFVFTASEELGLRGAKAAAVSICPDYAVALDVTITGDTPASPKMAVKLGQGVAVKIMDSSFIAHPIVKDTMISLCKAENISYQLEVLERGGTDAGAIHVTGGGVPSGCISVPTRFVHTPCEMVSKDDVKAAIQLTKALIEAGIA